MRRTLFCVFFIFLVFISINIYSQPKLNIKVSASNFFRYGNGVENSITGTTNKTYLEELGEARISINDFTLGVRYEFDDPIEFGHGVKGISRRYLEFKKDELDKMFGR